MENLYSQYPTVYDALYSEKDYDSEAAFAIDQFEAHGNSGNRVLIVGCGTGEHSRRLAEYGFAVLGVDKYEAMIERARTKSDATFHVGSLPGLEISGQYDLIWLPFTVIDHLPRDEFEPSLQTLTDHLASNGVLVLDSVDLPDQQQSPVLQTVSYRGEAYARLFQIQTGEELYQWDSIVFTPNGQFFIDSHELTKYSDETIEAALEEQEFTVDAYDSYGESSGWPATVFVAH